MADRAVLCDCGGVLLRQDWEVYEEFGEANGLPPRALRRALYGTEAWHNLQKGEGNRTIWREAAIESLSEHCGERAEGLFDEWRSRPVERHEPNLTLARDLQASGIRLGLLSNAAPDLNELLIPHFGVDLPWDDKVISGEVGLAKPDAAIYRLASERIGVSVGGCFFIDDLAENIEAAKSVGMGGYHFQGDYAGLEAALRDAGYVWESGVAG